jgi:hypothetical protein
LFCGEDSAEAIAARTGAPVTSKNIEIPVEDDEVAGEVNKE